MKFTYDYHKIMYHMIYDIVSDHTIVPNISKIINSEFQMIKVKPHKGDASSQ